MVKFSKEELLKLADLSALKLYEDEVDDFVLQIQKLLEYTEELENVVISTEVLPTRNVNVFREDEVIKFDSKKILAQAPKQKDGFFVVPKILKQSS
jgi:aspartyl-tRNA(Asn)/glutamyl-tRNA(Gln) amidotransferase subunit C